MGSDTDFAICYSIYAQADTSVPLDLARMSHCDNRPIQYYMYMYMYSVYDINR